MFAMKTPDRSGFSNGAAIPANELIAQLVISCWPEALASDGSPDWLRPLDMIASARLSIVGPVRAIAPNVASSTTTELTSVERTT